MHRRIRSVILVQGTQGEGLISYEQAYTDPRFKKLVAWAQEALAGLLLANGIDLAEFCQKGEGFFSQVQRNIAIQILTLIGNWVETEKLVPQLLSQQRTKRKLTRTLIVGHSFGLWSAAAFFGLWGGKTEKERFQKAMRIIGLRAKYTSLVSGSSLLIRCRPGSIDVELIRRTSLVLGDSAVAVVNSLHQVVVSGGPEALGRIRTVLEAVGYGVENFPLGPPWHSPRMQQAMEQLARIFRKTRTFRVSVPLAYLNQKGKLRSTKDPREIAQLLLAELTDPYNFLGVSLQLPENAEMHEVSIHGKEFLIGFVQRNRAEAEAYESSTKQTKGTVSVPVPA